MKPFNVSVVDDEVRQALLKVFHVVESAGGWAYLVGGCVRDTFLGLQPKDFDIEVYGITPTVLVTILSRHFSLDLVGEAFGVLKLRGLPIDISLPRRESKTGLGHKGFEVSSDPDMTLEEAAGRRDFTINAMAFNPITRAVFDPFGGLQDLETGTLRHTTSKFKEDPLRVLRGMQFAGRFSLQATDETVALSKDIFMEYDTIVIERIWGEWYKWASQSAKPSAGLRFLQRCQWIRSYPELLALNGCPQDPRWHPEGDVWIHTLCVIDQAVRIAERDNLAKEERAILVLAGLCHDLGKPATTVRTPEGIHSRGHTEREDIYRQFLNRIGAPSAMADRVVILCRYHLTHLHFIGSPKHVRRLAVALASAGETMEMLARLVEADHSGRPPLSPGLPTTMQQLMQLGGQLAVKETAPRPILLGRHLIELGISPGPGMGTILQAAFEAQLDGQWDTLESARDWVLHQYLS